METRRRILTAAILSPAMLTLSRLARAKKKKSQQSGVIAGTVFKRTGFSLGGAQVTITPLPAEGEKVDKKQIKKVVTDSRGEFGVRVPSGAMRYNVEVEAKGWQSAEQEVEVHWEQRLDLNFRLMPVPSGGTSK